jgi:hypothetical protein
MMSIRAFFRTLSSDSADDRDMGISLDLELQKPLLLLSPAVSLAGT